jgi:hypothetical protein
VLSRSAKGIDEVTLTNYWMDISLKWRRGDLIGNSACKTIQQLWKVSLERNGQICALEKGEDSKAGHTYGQSDEGEEE